MKSAGLHNFKRQYCDCYYELLTTADLLNELEYPNKHFAQIDKDLDRTYPDDPFFTL